MSSRITVRKQSSTYSLVPGTGCLEQLLESWFGSRYARNPHPRRPTFIPVSDNLQVIGCGLSAAA